MIWKEAIFLLFAKMCSVDLTLSKGVEYKAELDICS